MGDRGIIFSAPMVRALLDGRKSQTRRLVKPARVDPADDGGAVWASDGIALVPFLPPAAPGDRLWVREAHALVPVSAYRCSEGVEWRWNPDDDYEAAVYRAGWDRSPPGRWRPSIHMPRWASRLTLGVTEVRVQRLQEISEEDAIAEGIELHSLMGARGWFDYGDKPGDMTRRYFADPRASYRTLWDSLHGAGAWDANPWVCAISFTIHQCNIDRMEPQP